MKNTKIELTDMICPICKQALLREDNENKKDGIKQFVCTNNDCNTHFSKVGEELVDSYLNKRHKYRTCNYDQFVDMSKEFFANLANQKEIEEERRYREWRESSKEYIVRYLQEELGISIN